MKNIERYLISAKNLSIATADRAVYVETATGYYLNTFPANQIVIYDYATGQTVSSGITVTTVPKLVIAQAIDTDGDGIANVLRKPAGDFIDGWHLSAVTADPPSCGAVKILDVGIPCGLDKDSSYSLTIEARTDHTEGYWGYNDYERWTETFKMPKVTCGDDCDNDATCAEIACGIATRFNSNDSANSIKKQGAFIKRVQDYQRGERPFHVYPLHEFDYEFCFTIEDTDCDGCTRISAITGITIDGVTTTFTLNTAPEDVELTTLGQVDALIKQINALFGAESVGYALNAAVFEGSAKPCCDSVKILVNSCKEVILLGVDSVEIEPCAEGLPSHSVTVAGMCAGCGTDTTITPACFIRVVAKPIKLEKFCDTPDSYKKTLFTDIRVTTSNFNDNFNGILVFEKQGYEIPQGLGYQLIHDVYKQDTSANAPDVDGWFSRNPDMFGTIYKGSRTGMLQGLLGGSGATDSFCIYNIEHSRLHKDQTSHGGFNAPRFRTTIAVPFSNTAFRTAFEAIINPWIASAPKHVFKTVTCASDQDQVERILNSNTSLNTAAYPNANGTVL